MCIYICICPNIIYSIFLTCKQRKGHNGSGATHTHFIFVMHIIYMWTILNTISTLLTLFHMYLLLGCISKRNYLHLHPRQYLCLSLLLLEATYLRWYFLYKMQTFMWKIVCMISRDTFINLYPPNLKPFQTTYPRINLAFLETRNEPIECELKHPTISDNHVPICTPLHPTTINPWGGHCRHGIGIEATTHWCRSNHCCPQRSVWARGTGRIINGCSSKPRQFFWRRVSQHYPEYEADQ